MLFGRACSDAWLRRSGPQNRPAASVFPFSAVARGEGNTGDSSDIGIAAGGTGQRSQLARKIGLSPSTFPPTSGNDLVEKRLHGPSCHRR